MNERNDALVALGRALLEEGYSFVTVGPETHRRVNGRADAGGHGQAKSLRDVFGWNRPFDPSLLSPRIARLAREAGAIDEGRYLRSRYRFSSLRGGLFVHSAYPTVSANAVFFGPDTYRFCDLVLRQIEPRPGRERRVVDVGCGSGVGGIVAAAHASHVVLADINRDALELAEVNAAIAGINEKVTTIESDVLAAIEGPVDLVVANPPYMVDAGKRAYRDGGGEFGEAVAVRIVREALGRLARGGQLILYTGSAIVDGVDTFLAAVRGPCGEAGVEWRYWEIDPDVFGEEIEHNDAYANVERIAAVALVATTR